MTPTTLANDSDTRDLMNENARLKEALRPFAEFASNPAEDWKGTAWEDLDESKAVLHNHKTGREVLIGDFLVAKKVFES